MRDSSFKLEMSEQPESVACPLEMVDMYKHVQRPKVAKHYIPSNRLVYNNHVLSESHQFPDRLRVKDTPSLLIENSRRWIQMNQHQLTKCPNRDQAHTPSIMLLAPGNAGLRTSCHQTPSSRGENMAQCAVQERDQRHCGITIPL